VTKSEYIHNHAAAVRIMLILAIEHSMCTVFKMHHTYNLYSG